MSRFPSSAAILAVGCIASQVLGWSCDRRKKAGEEGPVVIIGVDGVAWEVIAPLLIGSEYPVIDWGEPVELAAEGEWRLFSDEATEPMELPPTGALLVRDSDFAEPSGLQAAFDLDSPSINRYLIEAHARALEAEGSLTVGVHYSFRGGDPPPRLPGNNETVCKTFHPGPGWGEVRLDIQPPTTASKMSILLLSGEVDCVDPEFVRVGTGKSWNREIEVKDLRLRPGRVRGLPEGGFDWRRIPSAKSRMPHLAKLMQNGVSGYLRNLEPTLSPVIWTSVATGEGPEDHGIEEFLMAAPGARGKIHVSSTLRRTPALWNIVTDYGQDSVGVVSWWATWPAEAVRGFVLTDHANEAALRLKEDRGYLPRDSEVRAVYADYDTYPRDLASRELAAAGGLRRDDLERLLPSLDDARWRKFAEIGRVDRLDLDSLLKFYLLKDLTTFRVGLSLFAESSPDLWMIYFNGQDSLQHLLWHFTDPDLYPRVDRSRLPLYERIVENYYAMLDDLIGRIVAAAGPDANLLVLSDHGVHGVDFMQAGTKSGGHSWRSRGILVAAGPAFKEGHYTSTASIFDIAPTVLSLLDYPVADNLKGEPLLEILRPDWRQQHPIRSIDRYEFLSSRRGVEAPIDTEFDGEVTDRLRALGYLD